jgi:hypothetical protein
MKELKDSLPLSMEYFSSPELTKKIEDINEEYIDFDELLKLMQEIRY